jgi:hypothetical protein
VLAHRSRGVHSEGSDSILREIDEEVVSCSNSERCTREISWMAPRDTNEQHRITKGDEHSRWLFVADEFAWRVGMGIAISVPDVQQAEERAAD